MKNRSIVSAAGMAAICLSLMACPTQSAEINVLAANGIQAIMGDLGPKFERATGHKLAITFSTGGSTVKRAQDGDTADVVIAPKPGIDSLVKNGKVAAENVTALASTGISVAVRKGGARLDISSPDALKRTLLASKSITYLNPADGGASGIHFAKVLERLGIAKEMTPKTILASKTAAVGTMVSNGEVEIGVLQYQLLFSVPGIEIIGPLPGDLQDSTVFAAAIMKSVREIDASNALISFLRSPEAAIVIKSKGMDTVDR